MVKWLSEAKLLEELRRIIDHGVYDLTEYEGTGGSGGVGRLMEILLGIQSNNAPVPDAVEFEIKTSTGTNLLTMLHKEPGQGGVNALGRVIPVFGWPMTKEGLEPGTLSFRQTIKNVPSPRGFRVVLGDKAIQAVFNPDTVAPKHAAWLADVRTRENAPPDGDSVWMEWTRDEITRVVAAKFRNLILMHGKKSDKTKVKFTHGTVFRGFLLSAFYEEMEQGMVFVDMDTKKEPSVGVRNHGTKIRIKHAVLPNIYEDTSDVEGG